MRPYNPHAHQRSVKWAKGKTGILVVPTIGKFENGWRVFVDQESFDDRMILIRTKLGETLGDDIYVVGA